MSSALTENLAVVLKEIEMGSSCSSMASMILFLFASCWISARNAGDVAARLVERMTINPGVFDRMRLL